MPDMATALKSALESWEPTTKEEKQMPPTLFRIRNNVTRETFAYIQQHPATTMKAALEALKAKGYKESSVSSIVSQLLRAKQIKRVNGQLFTLVPEYQTLKATAKPKAKPKAKAEAKVFPEPRPLPMPDESLEQSPQEWAVAHIKTLSVWGARALYDELKRVFEK